MANVGVETVIDNFAKMVKAVKVLTDTGVYVGFPADKTARKEGPITNAALGYIHELGAPEANIPPRPFLLPGLKLAQKEIAQELKKAGEVALTGDLTALD